MAHKLNCFASLNKELMMMMNIVDDQLYRVIAWERGGGFPVIRSLILIGSYT